MQSLRFYRKERALSDAQRQALGLQPRPSPSDSATLVGDAPVIKEKQNKEQNNDPFIVSLDNDEEPHNWSLAYKSFIVVGVCQIAAVTTFASAAFSPAYAAVAEEFGCAEQVAYLGTSMFLAGFGIGALLMAPLSEMLGRQPIYTVSLLLYSLFQIGTATSGHWWTVAITRFWAGFFGSTPLSNAGGTLADIFSPTLRTVALPAFACAGFVGPTIAPTISSFIVSSAGGWRWSQWLCAFWGFAVTFFAIMLLPESYKPALLELKAASLNKQYKTDKFKSPRKAETGRGASFNVHELGKALQMLVSEPIVAVMTFYLTLIYLILFGDLESYTLIYSQWDFTVNQTGLTFLSLVVGILICSAATPFVFRDYMIRLKRINGHVVSWREAEHGRIQTPPPEVRVIPLAYAAWLLPISMFWLGFTTFPSISPWPSIIAGIPFGTGLLFVFISTYQYVIDSYGSEAASGLAAMTFARYLASAGIVHATAPMMRQMSLRGGFSLLGGVSLVMCLAPFWLIRHGRRLRERSSFAKPDEQEPELGPIIV